MLRQGFGTKLSWVADPEQEIVFVGRDDDDARVAARLATAVGVRRLAGFLSGGMTSWRAERRDVAHVTRWKVNELASAQPMWKPSITSPKGWSSSRRCQKHLSVSSMTWICTSP